MQLSRNEVFIFVEGRDLDPDVYSRICSPLCASVGRSFEMVIADRIAGGGGGKRILMGFFEFLQANTSLLDRSQPSPKLAMFYLDKDVDDVFGSLVQSEHVVYTRHYSIENHLFAEGNFVSSLATAGSLGSEIIAARIADVRAWRIRAADCWRDWIALCLLARKLTLALPVGYAAGTSLINSPVDSPADKSVMGPLVAAMETRSGIGAKRFQHKLRAAYRLIDILYARSEHDTVFKGKWYVAFALRELSLASAI